MAALATLLLQLFLLITLSTTTPLTNRTTSSGSREDEIDYRLPTNVKPKNYNIRLMPTILGTPEIFTGVVEITVDVLQETDRIVLHYNDMDILEPTVTRVSDRSDIPVDYAYDEITHFCTITIKEAEADRTFKAGEHIIKISYTGNHRDDMYGFYRSSYKAEDGRTVWLLTTQFQPVHARRAFPCFDEPALKATFDISIQKTPGYGAISNMPEKENSNAIWHEFQQTQPMSSYLIAFVVSDFTFKQSPSVDREIFRVWSRTGAIDQADYSMQVGPPILRAMEIFLLGLEYELPKMDQVAVPDFSAGAMENWGLVTYRERLLLYDNAYANAETKQRIATVIAHEFGHQWFGDLVSPEWWNLLWLNEGFATYFESFATDMVETDWRLKEQFVVRDVHASLAFDALETSHPMTQDVGSPNSIRSIFDLISYQKAGSVIRMMEHFVTTEVFKKGLKQYITARAHSYANEDHLYDKIDAEFQLLGSPTYENVGEVMHTWSQQTGFPLVTVTSEGTNQLSITQKRFLLMPTLLPKVELWTIPLTYTVQDGDFENTATKQWMKSSSLAINRPTEQDKWYIFNVQQTGFYRVNYDAENWKLLINYLQTENYEKIHPVNRAQLLDDALTLARAGVLEYSTALDLTQYLAQETDYIPWYSVLRSFSFLNLRLAGTDKYEPFKNYILKLIDKVYQELEFEEQTHDSHVKKLHRGSILQWACNLDHDHCINTAREKFESVHGNNNLKSAAIPADLQTVVYCIAVRHGGEREWNILWNKYTDSNFASEQTLLLGALGCTTDQELINKYLTLSITANGEIRRQDAASVFSAVYSNPQGFELAFNFLQSHYNEIAQFYGTGVSSIITGIAARITTSTQLEQFKHFVETMELGAASEAAKRAVETAMENLEWVAHYSDDIGAWLEEESSTTVTPGTTTLTPQTTTLTPQTTTLTPQTTTLTPQTTTLTPQTTTLTPQTTTLTPQTTTLTSEITTSEPTVTSETPTTTEETTTPSKASSTTATQIVGLSLLINIIYSHIKF